ncbi:MAG: RICIN domain-containing protein [Oscillospiraceae bacterium]|nr:RICIN domain-containing protein [Oscillospiraceae bacterium]
MKKRFLLVIMVALLVASILPISAYAANSQQAAAVDYILKLEGKYHDVDGTGYDCVDLAKMYFRDIGGKTPTPIGIAANYANSAYDYTLPEGWVRMYYSNGYRPQPGDVAVWSGNPGHVALIYDVHSESNTIDCMEQNSYTQNKAKKHTGYNASVPICYIVPTFNQSASGAEVRTDRWGYLPGETVSIIASSSGMNFFTSRVEDAGGKTVFTGYSETTYVSFIPEKVGVYTVFISACKDWEHYQNATCNFIVGEPVLIPEGDYFIETALSQGMVMDVAGGSKAPLANIQIYTKNNTAAQKFHISKDGNYNLITNVGSLLAMDIADNTIMGQVSLIQQTINNTDYQRWRFFDAGDGTLYIQSAFGPFLDVKHAATANATGIWSFPFNGSTAQKWKLISTNIEYTPIKTAVYDGHTYALYDNEDSWFVCKAFCESLGGHLVTITSSDEQAFIQQFIDYGSKDAYWLGLTDFDAQGIWRWESAEPYFYANWCANEPTNSTIDGDREAFAEIRKSYSYGWNDVVNSNYGNKGFILEIDNTSPAVSVGVTNLDESTVITATPNNAEDGSTAVFAAYRDNKLIDVQTKTYVGESITVTTTADYDKIKVMLLSGNKTMTPLCPACVYEKE